MPDVVLAQEKLLDGRPMRVLYQQQRRWAQKIIDYLDKGLTIQDACTLAGVSRQWWWYSAKEFEDLKPTRKKRKLKKAS